MKRRLALAMLLTLGTLGAFAVEWRNLDESHHLAGRKTSSDYLTGKIVVVDRWGAHCPPCRASLPRVQALWESFKTQNVVVLGGHCAGWGTAEEVKALARQNGLTYPIYEDAGLLTGEPQFSAIPFLYVVDPTGRVVYKGHDERMATDVLVGVVSRWCSPVQLQDWQRALDFELRELPGHAVLRYGEFKEAFPEEAKKYADRIAALERLPEMAQLVKLVRIARNVSDFMPKNAQQRQQMPARIKSAQERFATLKNAKDPRIVHEAKNALADLTWAATEL